MTRSTTSSHSAANTSPPPTVELPEDEPSRSRLRSAVSQLSRSAGSIPPFAIFGRQVDDALAIACALAWLDENRAAVLAGWPRIPLPTDAEALRISAGLLDPDWPVPGVSAGSLTPPFGILGAVTRAGGGTLAPSELAVTASWGHGGHGRPVMPGQGRLTERNAYTADEMVELDRAATARGEAVGNLAARLGPPIDVWLNDIAYWRTVPRSVWDFTIGGYQVFKKWLSYREQDVLGRPMTTAEAREATGIIRRLAALVVMQPELDASYRSIRNAAFTWPDSAAATNGVRNSCNYSS